MELKDLLFSINTMQNKIDDNNEEITRLTQKQDKLIQNNAQLEKEIEKAKKLIHKQKLLQVNAADLCYELVNTLGDFDGYLTLRPIYKTSKLSKKDLPSMNEFLKEKSLCIDIALYHHSKPDMYHHFNLEYPLKDVVLNDGTKLIKQLTVEDNAIVVPEELESKIMINISLNDRAMTDIVFKKSVIKCIEKSSEKVVDDLSK